VLELNQDVALTTGHPLYSIVAFFAFYLPFLQYHTRFSVIGQEKIGDFWREPLAFLIFPDIMKS
jgi:hypothetical protein